MSFFLCPISVYATDHGGGGTSDKEQDGPTHAVGKLDWDEMSDSRKWVTIFEYVVAQTNTVVNGDFTTYLESQEDFKEYVYGKSPDDIVTPSETGLTIPADLVALIKQALIEYSQETNGFYLLPTTDYRTVPAEIFANAPQYRTFKNIVEEKGVIVALIPYYSTSFRFVVPFADPDLPISLVGASYMADRLEKSPWMCVGADFYGTDDWKLHKYRWQVFPDIDTVYHTCSVSKDFNGGSENVNFTSFGLINYDMSNSGSYGHDNAVIYSTTGEKMRVFVSASAMKNYSVGTRTVYFGKDFYDYTPADITATWDEINDRISHIDDILSQLLDKIGDADDEDKIEELLQEILDAIKNGGGGGNGDNQGGGNTGTGGGGYDDRTLLSVLGGYFSSVLGYLEDISYTLKGLVWIEADNKLDQDKSDLFDLIDKIWKDPETGSQEAADTLTGSFSEIASGITKKFPFSIPWDIYSLFTVFSGTPPPDTATYRTVTLGVQPFTVDEEDLEQDEHEAPYFVLPLRIDSFRIYEEVVIDLKDFSSVSKLSRGLLAALFAVFLIKFTIRIIELFRGGVDD